MECYSAILGGDSPLMKSQFEELVQKEIGDFEGGFNQHDHPEMIKKIKDYIAPNSEYGLHEFCLYGMRHGDNGFKRIATHGAQGYANISSSKDIIIGEFFEDNGGLTLGVYVKKDLFNETL